MFDDRMRALIGLRDEGEALRRRTRSAAKAPGEPGSDETGSVTVTLDEHGRVANVTVAAHWRSRLADEHLGGAVVEAVRDAAMRRLHAWGEAYAEPATPEPVPSAAGLQQRLDFFDSASLPEEEREAALMALLKVVESIEQGLDEATSRLDQTLNATHTGHSPHREVTVELTSGGDVTLGAIRPQVAP
jgi:hypothetical protein